MRRFDNADSDVALLFYDLVAKRLHTCPMHLRPKMMLRVIAVKEPDPIVKFVVAAHTPGERLVRVTAVVAVVAIEVGKTVAKVPERHKKTDVAPVQDAESDKRGNKQRQFCDSPDGVARVFAFQFPINRLRIFAEVTQECVFERMLGFTIMSMLVNRDPIDCFAVPGSADQRFPCDVACECIRKRPG
jgi:hypothetical protein